MYIITERHGIFNTNAIPIISTDGVMVYARCGNVNVPVSSNPEDMGKIAEALKAGKDYVVLGG